MSTYNLSLPLDVTAQAASNRVVDEPHDLTVGLIIPDAGPFYTSTVVVKDQNSVVLSRGVDWDCADYLTQTAQALGMSVHCSLVVKKVGVTRAYVTLQYVGGEETFRQEEYRRAYAEIFDPAKQFQWQELLKPEAFTPAPHVQDLSTFYDMNRISEPLQRLEQALHLKDKAVHDHIIQVKIPQARTGFETLFDTRLVEQLLPIDAALYTAERTLKTSRVHYQDAKQRLDDLTARLQSLQQKNSRQRKYYHNRLQAAALIKIAKKSESTPTQIAPIPKEISGMLTWWDLTDTRQNRAGDHHDKADDTRVLSGVSVSSTGLSMASVSLLNTVIHVPEQCTIVAVISNDARGLLVGNLSCAMSVGYGLADGQAIAKVNQIHQPLVAMVAGIAADEGEDYFLSNATQSQYGAAFGYVAKPTGVERIMSQIGGGEGRLLELIIYSRLLSLYEVDALSEYLRIKHGVRPVMNANAAFDGGYTGFDFSYKRVVMPGNAQECAILTVPTSAPVGPFAYALAQLPTLSHCWACIGSSALLPVWAQTFNSVAMTQLKVTASVILPDNVAASFMLRANDVNVGAVVVPAAPTGIKTLEFLVTPGQDVVKLELFQTRNDTPAVRMAFSSITVQRQLL